MTSFSSRDGLTSEYVMSIAIDGDTVWAGTRLGLCRSRDAGFEQYRSDVWGFAGLKVLDRVALQGVPALAVDREGSVWFGTQLDGLGRLRRSPLLYEGGGAPDEVGVDVRTLLEDPTRCRLDGDGARPQAPGRWPTDDLPDCPAPHAPQTR